MKNFIDLLQGNKWFKAPLAIFVCLYLLSVPSCQKDEINGNSSAESFLSAKSKKIKWAGKVKDIDGNRYKKVRIGDQIWMAENLRTSRYNDGTPIPEVSDQTQWDALTTGAFCWYNNDSASYENVYGKLYNFAVVQTGKLCPAGWHVPEMAEWSALANQFKEAGYSNELQGNELIEAGTVHWDTPFGTNETGFTALPGGLRLAESSPSSSVGFMDLGHYAYFYSSSLHSPPLAVFQEMPYLDTFCMTPSSCITYIGDGLSIRCIKN